MSACELDQSGTDAPLDASAELDSAPEETSSERPPPRSVDARAALASDAAARPRAADAGSLGLGDAQTSNGTHVAGGDSSLRARGAVNTARDFVADRCRPGVYAGTFSGELHLANLPVGNVSGMVRAKLQIADGSDNLTVSGVIVGADDEGNPVRADVSGLLDCATHQLVGRLEHGRYEVPRLLAAGTTPSEFGGAVTAAYSDNPPSAAGMWRTDQMALSLTSPSSLLTGEGSWSVALAAPNTPCDCD